MSELGLELTGAGLPPYRVGRDRSLDGADEGFGQVRAPIAQSLPVATRERLRHFRGRFAVERVGAGDQVIEEHTEAVAIGAGRGARALEQLGRHVERGAPQVVVEGGLRAQRPSCAEVHQHDSATLFADDVLRLDVTMQQTGRVHRGERVAQRHADQRGFLSAHRAVFPDDLGEGAALNELTPDPDAAVDLLSAIDGHHVGMAHPGEAAPFREHPGGALWVSRCERNELERDLPFESRVPCSIDIAEPAAAHRLHHLEPGPTTWDLERLAGPDRTSLLESGGS